MYFSSCCMTTFLLPLDLADSIFPCQNYMTSPFLTHIATWAQVAGPSRRPKSPAKVESRGQLLFLGLSSLCVAGRGLA
jgi:hypothetical protein